MGLVLLTGIALSGCGRNFPVLHPAGPVARGELHLIETASIAMGAVILFVFVLFAITIIRFRDRPGNRAPYTPRWESSPRLELIWFLIPVAILAVIAVPTVRQTYALARLPAAADPVIVDVTSLDWKWLFEYPAQGVATVGYADVPTGVPVLYELTANSPMNTFWVPQLGGMEYTMPGRVLPLWLEASKPGVYQGRSANFSGSGFVHMRFSIQAVSPSQFQGWVARVRQTAPAMTMTDYQALLKHDIVPDATYSSYPASTFPQATHGFTLQGGMYVMATGPGGVAELPATGSMSMGGGKG